MSIIIHVVLTFLVATRVINDWNNLASDIAENSSSYIDKTRFVFHS